MRYDSGGSGWAWFFGALLVAGLVLLIVVVVRLSRGGTGRGGKSGPRPSSAGGTAHARQVLDERYARGEISTEEYQERRRVLDGES